MLCPSDESKVQGAVGRSSLIYTVSDRVAKRLAQETQMLIVLWGTEMLGDEEKKRRHEAVYGHRIKEWLARNNTRTQKCPAPLSDSK